MKKTSRSAPKLGIRIRDIMTRDVATIGPDATVAQAAAQMRDRDVGMLPVCDGDRLLGLFTDRDVTVRAVAGGRNPARVKVREIMTTELFFCFDHEDVQEAVASFEQKQIRRLPILNRKKQLVGVLSIGDLAVDLGNRDLARRARLRSRDVARAHGKSSVMRWCARAAMPLRSCART